jgi:hypothetical protein
MAKHTFETDAKCSSCAGTGVYVGVAERDGFAVVCHTCKGSGKMKIHIEWEEFTGRLHHHGVSRVLEVNPGICAGINPKMGLTEKSFGGMPYSDWKQDKPFPPKSEMRGFTCPAWWYQTADYHKKPNWPECIGIGSFSSCQHFKDKAKCWKKFDEQGPRA